MERRSPKPEESRLLILKQGHLTEVAMELFSLDRLVSEESLATIEEHLLVCPHCQTKLEKMDTFHRAAKTSLSHLAPAGTDSGSSPPSRQISNYAIAAAIAFVLIPAAFVLRRPAQDTYFLELAATRAAKLPDAPAGRPLNVHLLTNGLPNQSLRATLVNAQGKELAGAPIDPKTLLLPTPPLAAGVYFLRLFDEPTGQLLSEFTFQVQP